MKKFSLSLISLLLLSACGNGNEEEVGAIDVSEYEDDMDETVHFEGFGVRSTHIDSWNDLEWFNEFAENVNVEINWEHATDQTASEQINLMFASNDLPDFFYSTWIFGPQDLVDHANNGQLIPLNDLIDEYAPNISAFLEARPEIRAQITTPDGNIYAIPMLHEGEGGSSPDTLFINTDWLEQVDMEMPTTTEEFKEALIAFRDADLNGNGDTGDEIPFSFVLESRNDGPHSLSGSFGVLGRFLGVKDEEVFFAPVQDEYRDYLEWMSELYKEGLIDPEAFTHDNSVYNSKVKSSTPIVGAYMGWSLTHSFNTTDVEYEVVEPLVGPEGDQGWNVIGETLSHAGFSITHENENPIRAIKWVDQLYEEENSLQVALGPIGHNIEKTDDGHYKYIDTPEGMTYDEFRHSETPGGYGAFALLEETKEKMEADPGTIEKLGYTEMYSKYHPDEYLPSLMFSTEDSNRISVLDSDIGDFTYAQIANFMMNGVTDSSWDEYITQLNQLGLEELVELHQKYYDNYLEVLNEVN